MTAVHYNHLKPVPSAAAKSLVLPLSSFLHEGSLPPNEPNPLRLNLVQFRSPGLWSPREVLSTHYMRKYFNNP